MFDPGYEWFLFEVKTAAMLLNWTSKRHDKEIRARFGIGRVRACRLYDAGYATPESRVEVGEQRIGAIIGSRVAWNVIRKIESGGKV